MDAVRPSDNDIVVLKRVNKSEHEFEVEISKYFSSEDLRKDPRNHCVPVLEYFEDETLPEHGFLVTPLFRNLNEPEFVSIDEVVEFIRQTLEVSLLIVVCLFVELTNTSRRA